jgi:hypothetical protein
MPPTRRVKLSARSFEIRQRRDRIAQLRDRIAKTIEYLKSVKQSESTAEGKEIKITFPSGQVRELTGQSLLLGNALPNFYFHATTAYDIIRQCGVEVGKRDFMGTPPA